MSSHAKIFLDHLTRKKSEIEDVGASNHEGTHCCTLLAIPGYGWMVLQQLLAWYSTDMVLCLYLYREWGKHIYFLGYPNQARSLLKFILFANKLSFSGVRSPFSYGLECPTPTSLAQSIT